MKNIGDLNKLIKKIANTENVDLSNQIGQQYKLHIKQLEHAIRVDTGGFDLAWLREQPKKTALGYQTKVFAEQLEDWANETIFLKTERSNKLCAA